MASKPLPNHGLAQAIKAAGSQTALARLIGHAQQTISDWVATGKPIPAEHVLKIEFATGIPRHELRPDIYPPQDYAPPARHGAEQPPEPASCPEACEGSGGPDSPSPEELAA